MSSPTKIKARPRSPRADALAAARTRAAEVTGLLENASTSNQAGSALFERVIVEDVSTVLVRILAHLDYRHMRALARTSKKIKLCLEGDAREFVLQRYLGPLGYRSYTSDMDRPATSSVPKSLTPISPVQITPVSSPEHARNAVNLNGVPLNPIGLPSRVSTQVVSGGITLNLRDLDAFLCGLTLTPEHYARFAREYFLDRLQPRHLLLARASTRAWNRVVLRLRAQARIQEEDDEESSERGSIGGSDDPHQWAGAHHRRRTALYAFGHVDRADTNDNPPAVYKLGRAPCLRVWVPTGRGTGAQWMSDDELIETEKEIWRAGAWTELERGDVVWNVAISTLGNVGKLIL